VIANLENPEENKQIDPGRKRAQKNGNISKVPIPGESVSSAHSKKKFASIVVEKERKYPAGEG